MKIISTILNYVVFGLIGFVLALILKVEINIWFIIISALIVFGISKIGNGVKLISVFDFVIHMKKSFNGLVIGFYFYVFVTRIIG